MIRARDLLERVFWSFVSGFLGSLLGAPAVIAVIEGVADTELDIPALGLVVISAVFAGLTAAANVVSVIARWRLSVLPNPGDGLPGLPTGDGGNTMLVTALSVGTVCWLIAAVYGFTHSNPVAGILFTVGAVLYLAMRRRVIRQHPALPPLR